jgi:hypothetical protein
VEGVYWALAAGSCAMGGIFCSTQPRCESVRRIMLSNSLRVEYARDEIGTMRSMTRNRRVDISGVRLSHGTILNVIQRNPLTPSPTPSQAPTDSSPYRPHSPPKEYKPNPAAPHQVQRYSLTCRSPSAARPWATYARDPLLSLDPVAQGSGGG